MLICHHYLMEEEIVYPMNMGHGQKEHDTNTQKTAKKDITRTC